MAIGIFLFYFLIFVFLFLGSRKKGEKFNYKTLLLIPAILALIMVLLSVIKIYFIYKILLIIFAAALFLLTYWHWGERIRRWFF
jgi:hypothetical protein